MKIAVLHPDLGIGGAERLIVDAALALKTKDHEICIFTTHHDPNHCFKETTNGSLHTVVIGDWLPRTVFGKLTAICAYIRMMYAAIYLMFFSKYNPDVVLCDIVSACIPFLKLIRTDVVFYCHFPDQLLTQRKNWLKKLYRYPLDRFEEWTTGLADVVIVNSKFTANVFKETFPSLRNRQIKIINPSINMNSILRPVPNVEIGLRTNATTIFVSINRYERKKNVLLAIEALGHLHKTMPESQFKKMHLIIVGGYDERVQENVDNFSELEHSSIELGLQNSVTFMRSPTDDMKIKLIHGCTAVLYTPSNEHFGIVPLEAMLLGRPVIACNSGGPLETIIHEQTGYLCSPTREAFAEKMALLANDKSLSRELGRFASEHVRKNFSFESFTTKMNDAILECRRLDKKD